MSEILAGDIGGTKTNLAIFNKKDPCSPLHEASYISAEAANLEEMVADFLSQTGAKVSRAAFGVAGPVINGRAQITKLPWNVCRDSLFREFSFSSVGLINDLVATAYGIDYLPAKSLITVKTGDVTDTKQPRAVLAPGTGLGEAFMLWGHGKYRAMPTEGGHVPFAPVNEIQLELLRYLYKSHPHISYDLLCSGCGLVLIYQFLCQFFPQIEEVEEVADSITSVSDAAPVISGAALAVENNSQLCLLAVNLFCAILAAEAANLALKFLASGGIYIGGGIPPKILPSLLNDDFVESFIGKGPMSAYLATLPITIINDPKTALYGAASLACF